MPHIGTPPNHVLVPNMAWKPKDMNLLDIASTMGNSAPGTPTHSMMAAELARRQTEAALATARATKWSVIAIAITTGLCALFAFLTWYAPRG
jgi:hypothetical protein